MAVSSVRQFFHWQYSGALIFGFYGSALALWGLAVSTDPAIPLYWASGLLLACGLLWSLGWWWTTEFIANKTGRLFWAWNVGISCLFIAIALTLGVWLARSYHVRMSQVNTGALPDRAYMEIEQPRIIFELGKPISDDVFCRNKTPINLPAQNVSCVSRMCVIETHGHPPTRLQEEEKFKDFEASLSPALTVDAGPTLFPPEAIHGGNSLYVMNDRIQKFFADGELTLLVNALMSYRDDMGRHQEESCSWFKPTADSPDGGSWHSCEVHNGFRQKP